MLVVIPAQMKDSVQHQDLNLDAGGMPQGSGILRRNFRGNRNLSRKFFSCTSPYQAPLIVHGGKRKHIGRFVLIPKTPIQRFHLRARGDQHIDRTA